MRISVHSLLFCLVLEFLSRPGSCTDSTAWKSSPVFSDTSVPNWIDPWPKSGITTNGTFLWGYGISHWFAALDDARDERSSDLSGLWAERHLFDPSYLRFCHVAVLWLWLLSC